VIEVYAVVDDPGPPLPAMAPLRAVARDGLALLCGPAGELDMSPDALWRHERVVEALMEDRDLLPVRYGTRLDDEAAAVRALDERHRELSGALDAVRGAVELSLRVLGEPDAAPRVDEAGGGAGYIRAKVRAAVAKEDAGRAIHEPLASLARADARLRPHAERELLRSAYLVERGAVEAFVARVSELQHAHPELQLLCTGPWPPYSFSET
jgi:hypothetical protein